MSLLLDALVRLAEEAPHQDSKGITTHSWIFPETSEIVFGGTASVIVIGLLVWKGLPIAKKAMAARTAKIQKELDDSANAKTTADAEAAQIRQAKGDIDGERSRLLAEADTQAGQVLTEGRARLEAEIAELEARADIEIGQIASRSGDELRVEISRLSSEASEALVVKHLDAATQNNLIENFIAKVGAA
jgi:F0F1-type ATP synthase membrane subunit b/b'